MGGVALEIWNSVETGEEVEKNEHSIATLKDNPIKCFLLLGDDDLRPSSMSSENISQLRQNTLILCTAHHRSSVTITLVCIVCGGDEKVNRSQNEPSNGLCAND